MSRFRNFVFTQNNYPNFDLVENVVCKYIAYAEEIAPTTGTPHLQGYISFVNAKTIEQARKLLPGCHVEVMRGSLLQNDEYVSKSGTLIHRG